MAYQITRGKKLVEDLELVNENGEVEEVIHVSLDAGSMVTKITEKYQDLVKAQSEIMNIKTDNAESMTNAYTKVGNCILNILVAVFGEEDTKRIVAFYDSNYMDLINNVIPFIIDVIIPKLRHIAADHRKDIMSKYNRKTRRSILKGWK